ncbi:cyclic pyranopterin monophosphate synthase MoaC [Fulvivirga sp.]|uniref:cyclic pyranopterin monophosphate synthase MoaC n=1 Tax=Fulvivirga sp. TaxID=1931237 RepID=UPI0032EF8BF2
MSDNKLTHIDGEGNPTMVDVSGKNETLRTAVAKSEVRVNDEILGLLKDGEISTKKGPVFHTSIIAGVMAAKKTSELIPFCHQLNLSNCKVHVEIINKVIEITCTATTIGKTGVEMEALTGASVAALTVYDMCKAMSHEIVISNTRLISKTGGKSDYQEK